MQALRMSTLAERRFVLDGERHAYHVARGNRTWDNERAVEIPVVWIDFVVAATVAATATATATVAGARARRAARGVRPRARVWEVAERAREV